MQSEASIESRGVSELDPDPFFIVSFDVVGMRRKTRCYRQGDTTSQLVTAIWISEAKERVTGAENQICQNNFIGWEQPEKPDCLFETSINVRLGERFLLKVFDTQVNARTRNPPDPEHRQ